MDLISANLLLTTVWLAILIGTGVGVSVYALAKRAQNRDGRRAHHDIANEGNDAGNDSPRTNNTSHHLVPDDGPAAKALVTEIEKTNKS